MLKCCTSKAKLLNQCSFMLDTIQNTDNMSSNAWCSKLSLQFAWVLALTCYGHHLGHALHAFGLHQYAHTEFMEWLDSPILGGLLGAAALIGPGRKLLFDGFASFAR